MEKAAERHADDSRNQLSARLAGRGNRTPQGGLVQLRLNAVVRAAVTCVAFVLRPTERCHLPLPFSAVLDCTFIACRAKVISHTMYTKNENRAGQPAGTPGP